MKTAALRTEGLTKRYGGFDAPRLLDSDGTAGGVLGYLGPNGAGKTIDILAGT
jgi:ABC-2 type transport system ATP-binding protein